MGTLPNLFSIKLQSNHLYREIPQELCQLPALISKNADLKLTQLNTELPFYTTLHRVLEQFNTFPRSLLLSSNELSGPIPSEIGKLQGLQQIDFANNKFSGNIPATMSNLTNLEMLRLPRNNLTGEIPASLTNLHFLSQLDLSYNDLEGLIPTGGQFNTFEQKDFQGNPQLCGEIIQRSGSNATKPGDNDQPHESGNQKGNHFYKDSM